VRGRLLLFAGAAALAVLVAAGATLASGPKPIIGKPIAAPVHPAPGKKFSVIFHVAHGTSAKFAVTLSGKAVRHTDSFHGGIARTSLTIPAGASDEILAVKLTARDGAATASTRASFIVTRGAALPSLSIGDATGPEGNSGTSTLTFHVTLSHASSKTVSVSYSTGDATATAPSDYISVSGNLTFKPGETSKTIPVTIVGDTAIEDNETFTVSLDGPSNATLGNATGTGSITNDDLAAAATSGSYKGATQEGNFVFFTVNADRTVSGFRANSITENCGDGSTLSGSVSFDNLSIPIDSGGNYVAQNSWSGSQTNGDIEYTAETWKVTGQFATASTVTGTIALADEFNYRGSHYSCSTTVTYSASLQ
jgi:hypothetical protein